MTCVRQALDMYYINNLNFWSFLPNFLHTPTHTSNNLKYPNTHKSEYIYVERGYFVVNLMYQLSQRRFYIYYSLYLILVNVGPIWAQNSNPLRDNIK